MVVINHKTFRSIQQIFWRSTAMRNAREALRREAEGFIMDKIGVENVVSITEDTVNLEFMVTVWYRQEREAKQPPLVAPEKPDESFLAEL